MKPSDENKLGQNEGEGRRIINKALRYTTKMKVLNIPLDQKTWNAFMMPP
jgi:hypothetical protein